MSIPPQVAVALIGPAPIPSQPMPTHVAAAAVQTSNGKPAVVLQVNTPAGVTLYFFDPKSAKEIGEHLIEVAREADSGIKLVSG